MRRMERKKGRKRKRKVNLPNKLVVLVVPKPLQEKRPRMLQEAKRARMLLKHLQEAKRAKISQ